MGVKYNTKCTVFHKKTREDGGYPAGKGVNKLNSLKIQ